MIIIPAIDILGSKCVRLMQGNYEKVTVYDSSPLEVAQQFVQQGAKRLHMVDLDGARQRWPVNKEIILSIAKQVSVPIQVGGGIRSVEETRKYLNSGVDRIILGTTVIEDQANVRERVKAFGSSRFTVSLDWLGGNLAVRGWRKTSDISLASILDFLREIGIRQVIVTDTTKDGTLKGPNFSLARDLLARGFEVTVAGGVTSLQDVQKLQQLGISGAIVGRALHEGKLDLQEALRIVTGGNGLARRIIPCLDIKGGRLVKGTHFKNLRDIGDPVEFGERYSQLGADELVFLDIGDTEEDREKFYELLRRVAERINIPFSVGGNVHSLEEIRNLLDAGADKVSIGSSAIRDPDLVRQAAERFGSQCIVISIDAKRTGDSWQAYVKGGTEPTGVDAIKLAQNMERLGAGELLVNSLDRDGTKRGFDIGLLREIRRAVNIPVIASSGAGSITDFVEVFAKANVDAALGASVFHDDQIQIKELKTVLASNGVPMRL